MKRYNTLLWDNDGVLVATEHLYLQSNREVLASVGVELSDDVFAHISLRQGASVLKLATHLDQQQHNDLRDVRNQRYRELLENIDVTVPGIRSTLEQLYHHYQMAIVTTSLGEHFTAAHHRAGLTRYFDFILTREDYRLSKPDPEPYLTALRRTGATSSRCLVIEDTPRGLLAARRAGLDCVVIPAPEFGPRDFPGATAVLNDIRHLPEFLLSS
jgi:HAD superfamily hydrolase (TIGR01509 family)